MNHAEVTVMFADAAADRAACPSLRKIVHEDLVDPDAFEEVD